MILARSAGKKKWPKWPHAVAFAWGFCNALLSDNSLAQRRPRPSRPRRFKIALRTGCRRRFRPDAGRHLHAAHARLRIDQDIPQARADCPVGRDVGIRLCQARFAGAGFFCAWRSNSAPRAACANRSRQGCCSRSLTNVLPKHAPASAAPFIRTSDGMFCCRLAPRANHRASDIRSRRDRGRVR
jgi:hypothetical protein